MRRLRDLLTHSSVFFLLFSAAVAQAETALSLPDAIRLARERSVRQIVSQERVRQALARSRQAFALLLPQVTLEAEQKRQTRNLEAMGIPLQGSADPLVGPFNSFEGKIRAEQMVFDPGAVARLLAVRAGEKTALADQKKTEEDAMALVAGLYLDAQRARQAMDFSAAFETHEKKRLLIAHRAFRAGNAAAVEIKEAKASFKESAAASAYARERAESRLSDLAVSLGFGEKEPIRLLPAEDWKAFGVPSAAPVFDPAAHPDAQAARRAAEQRKSEERIHWAEFFPKLSFMADYGLEGDDPGGSEQVYSFGAKATLPVFEGGQRPFRIAEAQSRTREAQTVAEDTLRRLEAEERQALSGLLIAYRMVDAKSSAAAAARDRLRYAKERFENGAGSEWEYVDALFARALAQDEQAQAASDYLKAHVRLAHALGQVERLAPGLKTEKK